MTIREDAFSTNGWNYLSTFLGLEGLALVFISPMVLVATWGIMAHTIFAFVLAFAATSPICLLLAWSQNGYVRKRSGFVVLEDGMLHYFKKETEPPEYSAPLEACLWFEGCRTWATLPYFDTIAIIQVVVGPQVLLLQFPDWCRIPEHRSGKATVPEQPVIVAVGQTPETREQWVFAIKNRNVECDTTRHQRRWPTPISSGLSMCWCCCIAIVSFIKLPGIAREITNRLINRNIPDDIAQAIGFAIFLPGIFVVFIWFAVFPLVWIQLQTTLTQKIPLWNAFWSSMVVLGFTVGSAWSGVKETFDWKLTYTITSVSMILVTFVCYCLLMRSCKRKTNNSRERP